MNRETNSVVNGRIELRRSGDILVATNGVEQLIPRQLPFEQKSKGKSKGDCPHWIKVIENGEKLCVFFWGVFIQDEILTRDF